MEPNTLMGFKDFLSKKLQQKFVVSNTSEELKDYINDYVDALYNVDTLNSSIHDSSKYWLEQNRVMEFVWDDCIEEIEDKDLGLIRKINLK